MTHETYENLMRVIEKRIRQSLKRGDFKAARKATEDEVRLREQFKSEKIK